MTTEEKQLEKGFDEIIGVFTDPILVFPGGWGDTLPERLKQAITMDRLIMNVEALKTGKMSGTDAEACAYLMTASLTQPMGSDWTKIYLYIATQVYRRHGWGSMPSDIAVDSLSDYQMGKLNRFKDWLYQQRAKIRQERGRAERREKKEADLTRKKSEQPALFEF